MDRDDLEQLTWFSRVKINLTVAYMAIRGIWTEFKPAVYDMKYGDNLQFTYRISVTSKPDGKVLVKWVKPSEAMQEGFNPGLGQ